jgi:site-specific recombinase XerD
MINTETRKVLFSTYARLFFVLVMNARPKKLLDQVRDVIRLKHYSYRTEESYLYWIRRYILFHHKRHPKDMGSAEIEAFLTHLAVEERVAASTQNQAFSAVLFLYRQVLHQPLDSPIDALRAKPSRYLPTVLTRDEVQAIFQHLSSQTELFTRVRVKFVNPD